MKFKLCPVYDVYFLAPFLGLGGKGAGEGNVLSSKNGKEGKWKKAEMPDSSYSGYLIEYLSLK